MEASEFLISMVEFPPPVVLAKLRLWCQHAKIKNFTPLPEIKRDFRRRRAEYETSKKEMRLAIQHISPNDVRTFKD
jgi:hypothetical protein